MLSVPLLLALLFAPIGLLLEEHRPMPPDSTLFPLTITTGEMTIITFGSTDQTVNEMLENHGFPKERMFIAPDPRTTIRPGMIITLRPLQTVLFVDGNKSPQTISTPAQHVGDVIGAYGQTLGSLDRITPPATTPLYDGSTITITHVTREERTEIVPIPFSLSTRNDPELAWGRERVIQKGKPGVAQEHVRLTSENGSMVARTILTRAVVEPQTPEILARGTKIATGRTVEGQASWYAFKGGDFAASTIFKRGSWLRVTNLLNNKQVIVRVNDYGPAMPDRVIDLDAVAFRKLWPLWRGVFPARVEEIL